MIQTFRFMLPPLAILGLAPAALAKSPETFTITPYADLRYRLELVDQAGLPDDATASTLRIRAGAKSGEWQGLSALIEGEAVMAIGATRYNDTLNGKTTYPVVADPTGAVLNQAYVRWRPVKAIEATVGRQAINVDNQRWIGSVNWRQNDQTLDAARVSAKPFAGAQFDYVHAWRVNRVFGPDSPQGIWHGTAIDAARAAYAIKNVGTLSAYGYWLDIPAFPANSSRTLGARIAGERSLGKQVRLLYAAEYARQHDFAGNPQHFALDYVLIEPGIAKGPVSLRAGYERLEGNGTVALQTPLATLHAFNGWADKFLSTPADGLRDVYIDAAWRVADKGPFSGLTLRGTWHDYRSTRAGLDYGREWDALASLPIGKHLTLSAKFARYDAHAFATDTTKGWFSIEAKY